MGGVRPMTRPSRRRTSVGSPQTGHRPSPSRSSSRAERKRSAPQDTKKGMPRTVTRYRVGTEDRPQTMAKMTKPSRPLKAWLLPRSRPVSLSGERIIPDRLRSPKWTNAAARPSAQRRPHPRQDLGKSWFVQIDVRGGRPRSYRREMDERGSPPLREPARRHSARRVPQTLSTRILRNARRAARKMSTASAARATASQTAYGEPRPRRPRRTRSTW